MKKHESVVENYLPKYHSHGTMNAIEVRLNDLLNSLLLCKNVVSILLPWVYSLFSVCLHIPDSYSGSLAVSIKMQEGCSRFLLQTKSWYWENRKAIKEIYTSAWNMILPWRLLLQNKLSDTHSRSLSKDILSQYFYGTCYSQVFLLLFYTLGHFMHIYSCPVSEFQVCEFFTLAL